MKKIVIICGIVGGLIAGGWAVLFIALAKDNLEKFDNGEIYGYTAMILAFSLVFVGVKNYRDKHLGGAISFGNAFKVSMLIVAIASTVYVVLWLIDYYVFVPDFAEIYTRCVLDKMKASGASSAAIAKQAADMAEFSKNYKNPFFNAAITYCEILPVGIVMALLASLILKKKRPAADIAA